MNRNPNGNRNDPNAPGLALPQDVAQQRAAQQQMQQQVHSMMINLSGNVLCQLAHADEQRTDWSRQRTNESAESHDKRLQQRCDVTATLAAKYAESLLNVLGVTQRPPADDDGR